VAHSVEVAQGFLVVLRSRESLPHHVAAEIGRAIWQVTSVKKAGCGPSSGQARSCCTHDFASCGHADWIQRLQS
jgi:hypothetical protein